MADLITEVGRFRQWADARYPDRRSGEWECNYNSWGDLYTAVFVFVETRPFATWSSGELGAVLYTLARDNEMQHVAREFRRRCPAVILPLAEAAILQGEREARWQLAVELGQLGQDRAKEERLLLILARDEQEYVRRRSLESLLHIDSPAVEELALEAWNRPDESQQWARMMVLECLDRIGSLHLKPLLAEAEQDERQYLREYAEGIRKRIALG